MSLIYDEFPTPAQAEKFAEEVRRVWGLEALVFDTVEKSDEHDYFPFALTPPIVHVERTSEEVEGRIGRFVAHYGGRFAGT